MILIDDDGHLTSTESKAELVRFADRLGLPPRLLLKDPFSHFFVRPERIQRAVKLGATLVSQEQLERHVYIESH